MTADREARTLSFSIATRCGRVAGLMVAMVLGIVVGVGVLTAEVGAPVDSEKTRWGWFAAISSIDDWFVLKGTAKVIISGTSLRAELYDARDSAAAITLNGTIRGGRVEVVAVRVSTEDRPRNLTGIHKRSRWKDRPGGRETILLSERGEPAGLTVGLTRELE